MKIYLKGQRYGHTPLSYPEYRVLFEKRIEYAHRPEDADIIIYSCLMDIRNDTDDIARIFALKPDIQLVVLSEEPMWDSLWSGDCFSKRGNIYIGQREYPFYFLNHWTTRIYDFEKIPYFITTSDDYFARYHFLFSRNNELTTKEIKSLWKNASVKVAFYAECRDDPQFNAYFAEYDVWGLCRYRTLIAQSIKGDSIVRVGKLWGNSIVRQLLPDWHLDKLAALDNRCQIVSGIENTHQWNYVSEKIFDAFAVMAIPIYFANAYHGVFRFVSANSFLNLYGLSVDQAVERICFFKPDKEFIDAYRETQSLLADTFSNPNFLVQERMRVVSEVIAEFEAF